MTAEIQTLLALAVVGFAAIWLISRALARRKSSGCGSDCGCPASEIKLKPGPKRPAA